MHSHPVAPPDGPPVDEDPALSGSASVGTATHGMAAGIEMDADRPLESWDDTRWQRILDRMEHRQEGVGLKFWGPPLWLEVTMTGPDSDAWSIAAAGDLPEPAWNWLSARACAQTTQLVAAGADDELLLQAASRYTVENLILNAAHEIGEWLRFDGKRLFPAHADIRTPGSGPTGDGLQGNGPVVLTVLLGPWISRAASGAPRGGTHRPEASGEGVAGVPAVTSPATVASGAVTRRAEEVAAGWRFTYLPGRWIAYAASGPRLTEVSDPAGLAEAPGCTWSAATNAALDGPVEQFLASVQHDVHEMLVRVESQRICDAFHVDGRRPWDFDAPGCALGPAGVCTPPAGYLAVRTEYL